MDPPIGICRFPMASKGDAKASKGDAVGSDVGFPRTFLGRGLGDLQ